MNICRTCKFFKSFRPHSRYGTCSSDDVYEDVEPTGLEVDGVEFDEEFGCIHHEDKA